MTRRVASCRCGHLFMVRLPPATITITLRCPACEQPVTVVV